MFKCIWRKQTHTSTHNQIFSVIREKRELAPSKLAISNDFLHSSAAMRKQQTTVQILPTKSYSIQHIAYTNNI